MNPKLWMEARSIAGRHAPAEPDDLAQDLALAVLERAEEPRNAAAWLERVGRNAAIDRWRVDRRRRELLANLVPPAGAPDPESVLLARESRQLVRGAVAALPRSQRRAALARFHAGLSCDEAAAQLGTQPATVRTRVHRALAALRGRLAALRALLIVPGAPMAALGVAIVVAQAPSGDPVAVVIPSDDQMIATGATSQGHRAPHRVLAAAFVTPKPKRSSDKPAAAPQPEPVQSFVFDEDAVDGNTTGPDGDFVRVAPPLAHSSLIELRRDFAPELLKTLEDL